MFFNLKKNKFNTYFNLCIILILILIAIIIVYSYVNKKNTYKNEKFAPPGQVNNDPIYELPLNTTLANLSMISRFYLDLILDDTGNVIEQHLGVAIDSILKSSSCWSSTIKNFSVISQEYANIIYLELPSNISVSGFALMSCADDPTKYIETFYIGYVTSIYSSADDNEGLYIDADGAPLIFNTNLTGKSNETSYILLPSDITSSLLSKQLLFCMPVSWSSQPAWRIDLLLNIDPKTTQNQQTLTTTQASTVSTAQASTSQASNGSTTTNSNSMSKNIPLKTYGYNIPKTQSRSSPDTEIYQHNFEGTSNVYSPAIYYNMESFDPINFYDAKFEKY